MVMVLRISVTARVVGVLPITGLPHIVLQFVRFELKTCDPKVKQYRRLYETVRATYSFGCSKHRLFICGLFDVGDVV